MMIRDSGLLFRATLYVHTIEFSGTYRCSCEPGTPRSTGGRAVNFDVSFLTLDLLLFFGDFANSLQRNYIRNDDEQHRVDGLRFHCDRW